MITIPCKDYNDFVVEAELDEVTYFVRLSWNSHAQAWFLSLENANNDLLLSGVRIVTNALLLSQYHHLEIPGGELIAVAVDDRTEIGRNDLINGQVELVYMSSDELS
jgi:hypothetical protein